MVASTTQPAETAEPTTEPTTAPFLSSEEVLYNSLPDRRFIVDLSGFNVGAEILDLKVALSNVTYEQIGDYPMYYDTAMLGWFQEINGVK